MRIGISLFSGFWLGLAVTASGTERFVPQGGAFSYSTIQLAIAASAPGDIVRVQPGVYRESVNFRGIDITLSSVNPADSNVVRSTVIEGDGTKSVVTFAGGQSTNAVLTGFTIRGGGGTSIDSDVLHLRLGGGIYCDQSSPSIIGNVIEGNRLPPNLTNIFASGGGIACLEGSPRIARNIIRKNSAYAGGGIYSDSGTPLIEDNWVYDNIGRVGGGVLLVDHGQFIDNTICANSDDNLDVELAGVVMNNIVAQASNGIGVVVGPRAGDISKWFWFNDNWGNPGGEMLRFQDLDSRDGRLEPGTIVTFSGISGNFSRDPRFVDPSQLDYHLAQDSPCINAGDPNGFRSSAEFDIDGASRVFALATDLGAAERHEPGNYPPVARAGSDHSVDWQGDPVILDRSLAITSRQILRHTL